MTEFAAYVQTGQLVRPDADSLGGLFPLRGIGCLRTATTSSRVASGDSGSGSGSGTRSRMKLSLTGTTSKDPSCQKEIEELELKETRSRGQDQVEKRAWQKKC